MFRRASKRAHRSRLLTFESLESRMCLSGGGVVALPGWGWDLPDTNLPNSSSAEFNQAITTDSAPQQSPSIAVDPQDPNHLVLAYMDFSRHNGYAGIGVSRSLDGGQSWQPVSFPLPEAFALGAADPIVKFDRVGHVFVSWVSFEGLRDLEGNTGVFVARSDDGGLTWRQPVAVTSHVYDGITRVPSEIFPDMAVDNVRTLPNGQANPNFGNLYVTWTRFYPAGQFPGESHATGGSDVMIAVSRDSGLTWQTRTQTESGTGVAETVLQTATNTGAGLNELNGFLQRSRVAVGATGDVSVADFAGAWFYVNHSDDAGQTFHVPNRDDLFTLPFGPGSKLLTGGLTNNRLLTVPMRAIAADPVRPGYLYVAEPLPVLDALGIPLDAADIAFARSQDYGRTWTTVLIPNGFRAITVNDDNGRQPANGQPSDVAADQFMVRMQVNAEGDVGLVWYDTRRDPANHRLDVFGAVSTDGGRTFSPNFRVTDQSFDPDAADFIGANGITNLGDAIGLAMTRDAAYVVWTDTRAGNEDIYFRRLSLQPPPPPLNDRFEPNDGIDAATDLGRLPMQSLPRLALDAGDSDWFRVESLATGALTVTLRTTDDPTRISLQILDADGGQVVSESSLLRDAEGTVIGRQVVVASIAGQRFAIKVASTGVSAKYSLETTSLTADLGPLVYRNVTGTLQQADQAYYLFETTAAGSVSASLAPVEDAAGNTRIEVLDAKTLSTLAKADGTNPHLELAVTSGQRLLLRVTALDASPVGFAGKFRLQVVNLDQYASSAQRVLRFPSGVGPSQMAVGDFNGDGVPDVAVTNTGVNTVSVSLANGDGTFAAPRQYGVGAFRTPNQVGDDAHLNTYRRDILAADFNHDGRLDLVVTNYDSADVSLLLGVGDGTFQPQRRFDAAAFPIGLTAGDVNGDGNLDLLVVDSKEINKPNKLAVLLGRGDGTFQPQRLLDLPNELFLAVVALGDLDNNGTLDLIAGGGINDGLDVFRGVGDGSFEFSGHVAGSRQATSLAIVDLDRDGNLDVVATSLSERNSVTVFPGKGDLRFGKPQVYENVGQGPLAVQVADLGSPITLPDNTVVLGSPDRHLDLIVANSGVIPGPYNSIGPPSIVLLPGLTDGTGFGLPIRLAGAEQPLDLELADFDGDGELDIAVVDRDGFFVIYANPPNIKTNETRATARDLGTVVHSVQPTLTIVPGHSDAWFRMNVAGEAIAEAGDQVIDFSAGFAHVTGAGLRMEVVDRYGQVRGAGDRVRIVARQGEGLFVHVFSVFDADGQSGAGAYSLVIDTLPQLVNVEAPALLPGQGDSPGGPTTSLVLVFQGDRLDPISAQNPNNYRVTWLGPDGRLDTSDDRVFLVGAGINSTLPVVYNPSGNLEVAGGRSDPKAVRQTVTLLFSEPLPTGSYKIEVSTRIQAAPFNSAELRLLTQRTDFTGHGVVSQTEGRIEEGARRIFDNLVRERVAPGNFNEFETGTRFLTQLHADLGALLDSILSAKGDNRFAGDKGQRNTEDLLTQIVARISPSLGAVGERLASILVVLLDPVSISLVDPAGKSFQYDLQLNTVANNLSRTFVEVGGNVELVVIAQPSGAFNLLVSDVPPLARGGWAYLGNQQSTVQLLTAAIRGGERSFRLGFDDPNPAPSRSFFAVQPVVTAVPATAVLPTGNALLISPAELRGAPYGKSASAVPYNRTVADARSSGGWAHSQNAWDRLWNSWLSYGKELRSSLLQSARNLLKRINSDASDQSIHGDLPRRVDANIKTRGAKDDTTNAAASRTRVRGQGFDEVHFRFIVLQNRNAYGTVTGQTATAGAVAPVPENAGTDANRNQVPSQDRRVGHRATDDARSTPRAETVSR